MGLAGDEFHRHDIETASETVYPEFGGVRDIVNVRIRYRIERILGLCYGISSVNTAPRWEKTTFDDISDLGRAAGYGMVDQNIGDVG